MPNDNLAGQRDIEAKIENLLTMPITDAASAVRSLFVEGLDFNNASGNVSLHGPHLPASASLVARREGVGVAVVVLPETGMIRVAAIRAALGQCAAVLGPDLVLVVADARGDEWQIVTQKPTAGRDLLRRMVIQPNGYRTVIEQLEDLWRKIAARQDFRSALDAIYDVEPVRKRFFKEYDRVFSTTMDALRDALPDNDRRKLFCQKLFNRLLFIRFIEKKGWLRFADKQDYLSALWEQYRTHDAPGSNFYRDRLRPVFFAGLNRQPRQRPADNAALIGTMPYLNGGLFEEDADDRDPAITVPDALFTQIIRDGRTLGLLYAFNFTVTEATPLDVVVAVDPEMLGKVFEELVTGRHESGSYYTPKNIVTFMCREALKGFLGDGATVVQLVDGDDASAITVPEARQLMTRLDALRAVDPACGSGAYLLGLLQELVRIYHRLDTRVQRDARSQFDLKMELIQRSLYGVDIDPFAVNIARLRLWLSLIVEYEGDDPPPLPNLDFKVEVGDSLTAPSPENHLQLGLQKQLFDMYKEEKAKYLTEHDHKTRMRAQIANMKTQIAGYVHGGAEPQGFDWLVEFAEVFAEGGFDIVLANPPYINSGVLLQQFGRDYKDNLPKLYPDVGSGSADIYVYFYGRALQLLRPGGMLAFISSNKWFRARYGAKLRQHIAGTCAVRSITDFRDLRVFESAIAYPMIFLACKGTGAAMPAIYTQPPDLKEPYPDVRAVIATYGKPLPEGALNGTEWTLADADTAMRLRQMSTVGMPLGEYVRGQIYRGVVTGFNDAF